MKCGRFCVHVSFSYQVQTLMLWNLSPFCWNGHTPIICDWFSPGSVMRNMLRWYIRLAQNKYLIK